MTAREFLQLSLKKKKTFDRIASHLFLILKLAPGALILNLEEVGTLIKGVLTR